MAVVKEDKDGIFVVVNGQTARPGNVIGYAFALRMDGAGLVAGDKVKAADRSQSPIVKVTLDTGAVVFWHADGLRVERTFDFSPEKYDQIGRIKDRPRRPQTVRAAPREIAPRDIAGEGRDYIDADHEPYLMVRQSYDGDIAIVTSRFTRAHRNGDTTEMTVAQVWSAGSVLHARLDMESYSIEKAYPHVIASSDTPSTDLDHQRARRPR